MGCPLRAPDDLRHCYRGDRGPGSRTQRCLGAGVAGFALGCFWGGDLSFGCVDGVTDRLVGYAADRAIAVSLPPSYETYAELGACGAWRWRATVPQRWRWVITTVRWRRVYGDRQSRVRWNCRIVL